MQGEHEVTGGLTPPAVNALHDSFLRQALRRFFQRAAFEVQSHESQGADGSLMLEPIDDPSLLVLRSFGHRYALRVPEHQPFTEQELRFARAITSVLAARYRTILNPNLLVRQGDLFGGVIEDRYVGAFLSGGTYDMVEGHNRADRIAAAIEVLRVAALSTYENRPISTGLLLLGTDADAKSMHRGPQPGAHTYTQALTEIKSFYRLADGVRTLFLVAGDGLLIDIIDVGRWAAEATPSATLPVPCARPYRAHARATYNSSHVCLVLSPTQEMKIFADGAQLFTFRNADWHLLDLAAKYDSWSRAVGSRDVAERLFGTALDLADMRQGALFVVVDDPRQAVPMLLSPGDLLDPAASPGWHGAEGLSREDLRYLLAGRSVTELDSSVFAALSSVDGAIVSDRSGRLLAVGAILRHPPWPDLPSSAAGAGARTTAAISASRFGPVLKVSEDGIITFYDREPVWEI
jgi:hypothetical protein